MNKKNLSLVLFFLIFSHLATSQDKKTWDVNKPEGEWKSVKFSTDEGTWLNLDLSPDGKTLVFDLLGDIYSIPSSGGTAQLLKGGISYDVQPRFNNTGTKLVYTSDAGGGDNIWMMNADGTNSQQITKEDFRLLNNPVWVPGTDFIVARKHFTSTRSLGAGEIWMYHISGGSGIQLTKKKNDQQDVNEPCFTHDGKYLYYSEDMYEGGYFQYNKDPNSQIYVIKRYDRLTGETETIVGGPGGAVRPEISHDDSKLAFVRRVRTKSVLCILDLKTGQEYSLYDGLDKDQQEAWAIFGVNPGFAWSPDDSFIYIWAQGKIKKINIKTKAVVDVPFKVNVDMKVAETLQFQNSAFQDSFQVKVLRHLKNSPDGNYCVYSALGQLCKFKFKEKTFQQLTKDSLFAFEPSFSPDGKSLLYVSWSDYNLGNVRQMDLASGKSETLTKAKGLYRTPSYSSDGSKIVYRKEDGNTNQGYVFTLKPGIYTLNLSDRKEEFVCAEGESPIFAPDGRRIYYQTGGFLFGSLTKAFKSVKLDGSDLRIYFNTTYATQFTPSPDFKWVAFIDLHKVYIAAMPESGQSIGLSGDTKAFPVAQVSKDAGINLDWSRDSKSLSWVLGNQYFKTDLNKRFKFLQGAPDSLPPLDSLGLTINMKLQSYKPSALMAYTNARIITMEGDQVIEKGTIIVRDNIIESVQSGTPVLNSQTTVIDCSGKTVMPGIVDVHAHLGAFRYGISPQQHWQYFANLAYGVTTTHDPSSNSEMAFSQSEMVKYGIMTGPRIFSTGTILYGADGDFKAVINSLEDARSTLRRTGAYGAFSVKSYNQPRRDQRQQIIQAAREQKMLVVPEGGSFFYHNMTQVIDGHTGVEHNIPVAPLYKDVINLWAATKTHNTPTLIVNYGGMNGEVYWYQNTNVWENNKLLTFTPRAIVDSRSRHRTMVPDEEYETGHILTSKSCKKLQDAGVNINLGSHGQLQGLGAHWELWMLQQGGMSNLQSLRCATLNGAKYLGMDAQIGSLKAGKLADFIILDKNPLDDIRNTEAIANVVANGSLFDPNTMNELNGRKTKRKKFYWEMEGAGNNYPFSAETSSFMPASCICGRGCSK